MQKHRKHFHDHVSQSTQSPAVKESTQRSHMVAVKVEANMGDKKLEHPFTMIASGPTSCGKTTFVKNVLLQRKIEPWPQRIVWMYKHWQPAYDIIRSSVGVEFIQGIPLSLDFDPNIRNLCVIDDMMSEIAKDARITQLFTEGSHHCNLSVLILNQNLYHDKDPTQRRNTQYLALWNCPSDKSQIMTLAQRMFPGQSHVFMNKFHEATAKPYGYLFVDLKPYTTADKRLVVNAFDTPWIQDKLLESSNDKSNDKSEDKSEDMKQTCVKMDIPSSAIKAIDKQPEHQSSYRYSTQHLNKVLYDENCKYPQEQQQEQQNTHSVCEFCDDCGAGFATVMDVMRHMEDCGMDETKERPEDNVCFADMLNEARSCNEAKFKIKYKKYRKNGMPSKDAQSKAEQKCCEDDKKAFFKFYKHLLKCVNALKDNPVHKNIMKDLESCRHVGRVMMKYRHEFDNLLDPITDESENDSDDKSEDGSEVTSDETEEDEAEDGDSQEPKVKKRKTE